ncbi:5-formyltetrahydrofolate cyclo-ligase [Testicularia cyperi]|uniref:5-formyltetrahydrofolate cyclo-ligase n=1 Tax=Testicularia cyperi TaxID=1882483 RepID=A0A317XQY3_9BASI|nr:5-formyltetrahydrofolate cyclo-ligase [Testicularia cyperi]
MSAAAASSSAATSVRLAKRQLRKHMAQTLASLRPQDVVAQSKLVAEQVLNSQTYAQSNAISVYVNMDVGEVVTDHICRRILRDGKRLYVPLFASPSTPVAVPSSPTPTSTPMPVASPATQVTFAQDMVMLHLLDEQDYELMATNKWGIREPMLTYPDGSRRQSALDPASATTTPLDLILAPGVAFDNSAARLGHGKGYYDRYLAQAFAYAEDHNIKNTPVTVALALREQILPRGQHVPTDEQDRVLDAIITPDGCILPPDSPTSRWQP